MLRHADFDIKGGLRTFAADAKDITEIMGTGLSLRFV
jgi:hypothetical protein